MITSVSLDKNGKYIVQTTDKLYFCCPDNIHGSIKEPLKKWLETNTPSPYVSPLPLTEEERIDSAFPQTDTARVIFEAFFELTNEVRTLKGQALITRAQLRDWLKAKLP